MAEDVLISDHFPKPKRRMKTEKLKPLKDVDEIPLTPHSDTSSKTKARFDQLLKQAVDQGNVSDNKPKKKKKKTKKVDSDDVLEKLKKGEGLVKDEDAAIIANTYVPGDSPKNRKDTNLGGTDNLAYEDETIPVSKGKKKTKKDTNISGGKSVISEREEQIEMSTMSERKLPPLRTSGKKTEKKQVKSPDLDKSSPLETENKTNEIEISSSTDLPKKGTKKKKKPVEENTLETSPRTIDSGTEETIQTKTRKKKKPVVEKSLETSPRTLESQHDEIVPKKTKKKKRPKEELTEDEEAIDTPRSVLSATEEEVTRAEIVDETLPVKERRKKKKTKEVSIREGETTDMDDQGEITQSIEDDGRVLAINIHRTDKLKNDFYIMHPVIRVHIVDEKTGQYLRKQDSARPVTSFYENQDDNLVYIQPIITQPYDFKQNKSVLPMWEELLLFNESFNYFIQKEPKVIIFFEVLDFVSMNTASRQYSEAKQQGGWHKIAWAFLKVVGSNDKINTGNKVRLQLYHPPERFQMDPGPIEIFQWWQTIVRRPYPSTLYITLKGISAPSTVQPSMRSLYATQQEVGRLTYQDLKNSLSKDGKARGDEGRKKYLTSWSRLAGQACKVPNNLCLSLYAGKKGCFVLKFSHDGRSLACGCHDQTGYPIYIYEIPSGELLGKLSGHFGLVYDLCWRTGDTHILSASSDGTARLWDLSSLSQPVEQIFPHPAFVYSAQFHPHVDTVVVTGCYDQVIRVWQVSQDQQPELKQEIEGHRGHVNSVCFDEDGSKLYSADSVGSIKIWNVFVSDEPSRKGFIRDWIMYHELNDPELVGVPINHLKVHPSGRRLLVHCRDNIIRMLDLRILRVMQKYIGALNFREELHSTITPCGTFVLAGSEDGSAYVWNTETGDQVVCYSELNYYHPVTGLDYHPRDHMVAFASLGENQAVFIYNYNPQVAALDAGIPVKPAEDSSKLKNSTVKSTDVYTKDEFEASETARLEKVMQKLSSVTLSARPMIPAENHPLGMHPSPRSLQTGGLLGSTSWGYDQTYLTPRSQSPPPPLFSPHAPSTLTSSMQQQQLASQSLYHKQSEGGWRPEFSSVGRHGARPPSPTLWGKSPAISMNASGGKAQFSFHAPVGKGARLRKVVALYEYKAQRSDELSFLKGEIIKVLYKDNENWWMGELKNGLQGFFPANYVTDNEPSTDEHEDLSADALEDTEGKKKEKKKVNAYKSKTGELKFMSATDDSEDDSRLAKPRSRRRKNTNESTLSRGRKRRESESGGETSQKTNEEESYA